MIEMTTTRRRSMDPLVSAIATAVEETLERGIEVKPVGDGWFIRVAPQQNAANDEQAGIETGQMGRSW